MKNSKKLFVTLLCIAVLLICATGIIMAATLSEKPAAVLDYVVGLSDEKPEYADANGDGRVNVLDIIALINQEKGAKVYLKTLTLDDDALKLF